MDTGMQASLFDYAALDSETESIVHRIESEIDELEGSWTDFTIRLGAKYSEMRSVLRHNKTGGFEAWVRSRRRSLSTVYRLMSVYETFGNLVTVTRLDLAPKIWYLLASPSTPEPARVEVFDRVATGEPMTFGKVRQIVNEHMPTDDLLETANGAVIEGRSPMTPPADDSEDSDWTAAYRHVAPIPEQPKANHQLINASTSNEWYTPRRYLDAVHAVMGGVDLDPASNPMANENVRATRFYTIDDDGYAQEWRDRVFLNPPYGTTDGESNQARWSRRLVEEYRAGNVTEAVLLVNAVPGNQWFAPLWDFPICFPDHRIRFYNTEVEAGQPTHSNALVYLGRNIARFVEVFSQFGTVAARLGVEDTGVSISVKL